MHRTSHKNRAILVLFPLIITLFLALYSYAGYRPKPYVVNYGNLSLSDEKKSFANNHYYHIIADEYGTPPDSLTPYTYGYISVAAVRADALYHGERFLVYNNCEESFFHSGNPSYLVVHPIDSGDVQIHWLPDMRFDSCPYSTEENLQSYKIYRVQGTQDTTLVAQDIAHDADVNYTWTDTTVQPSTSYRYFVHSLSSVGELEYSWPETTYNSSNSDTPSFWIQDITLGERVFLHPESASIDSTRIPLTVVIAGYNSDNADAVWLEVDYKRGVGDRRADGKFSNESFALTFTNGVATWVDSLEIDDPGIRPGIVFWDKYYGGVAFRIKYLYDSVNYYIPIDGSSDGFHHAYLTNVNNRIHARGSDVYWLNPASSTVVDEAIVLANDQSVQDFDGIFIDGIPDSVAANNKDWNTIEYPGMAYKTHMEALLQELKDDLGTRAVIVNGFGRAGYVPYLNVIDGSMTEHFAYGRPTGYSTMQAGANWLAQISGCIWARDNYPAAKIFPLAKCPPLHMMARIYALASYLLVEEDSTFFSSQFLTSVDAHFYPEYQIDLGDSLSSLSFGYIGSYDKTMGTWEDLQATPANAPAIPVERRFENGWVAVNYRKDSSVSAYTPTGYSSGPVYKLVLEDGGILDGGRFITESIELPIALPETSAVILCTDSIASPLIEGNAVSALLNDHNIEQCIKVRGWSWNRSRLNVVKLDATPIGGSSALYLADDGESPDNIEDDGIYTSEEFNIQSSLSSGEYELAAYLMDEDGYEYYGTVKVDVLDMPAARFSDKSSYTAALDSLNGTPYSSVAFDFDNDEDEDLMITVQDEYSQLFQNWDIGSYNVPEFRRFTPTAFPGGPGNLPQAGLRGLAVADYDKDGDLDFFAAHNSQARLYINSGDPNYTFTDYAAAKGITPHAALSFTGAWGDYNQDGWLDLFVGCGSYGGQKPAPENAGSWMQYLFANDGQGSFVVKNSVANLSTLGLSTPACVATSWIDVNKDLKPDLFVGLLRAASRLYVNKGLDSSDDEYKFENQTSLWFPDGAPDSVSAVTWLDFDGDGDMDLAVARMSLDGDNSMLYRNNIEGGDSTFTRMTSEAVGLYTQGRTIGLANFDYDLNGHMDLLALPEDTLGIVALYANGLPGVEDQFTDVSDIAGINMGRGDGISVADFTKDAGSIGDGDLDFYLGRTKEKEFFYRNEANDGEDEPLNNWLRIILEGNLCDHDMNGIGAVVGIEYGATEKQTQVVDGGSGRGGQLPRNLVFGLGDFEQGIVYVTVRWPNGGIQEDSTSVVSGGNELTISEPDGPPVKIANSENGTYVAHLTGRADWIFSWRTEYWTNPQYDVVKVWDGPRQGPNCYTFQQPMILDYYTNNVSISVEPAAEGGYKHTVTLSGMMCYAPCGYRFHVHSEFGCQTVESDTTDVNVLYVSVCMQE